MEYSRHPDECVLFGHGAVWSIATLSLHVLSTPAQSPLQRRSVSDSVVILDILINNTIQTQKGTALEGLGQH